MQGDLASIVFGIDVCAYRQEVSRQFYMTVPSHLMERCLPTIISAIDVRSGGD